MLPARLESGLAEGAPCCLPTAECWIRLAFRRLAEGKLLLTCFALSDGSMLSRPGMATSAALSSALSLSLCVGLAAL